MTFGCGCSYRHFSSPCLFICNILFDKATMHSSFDAGSCLNVNWRTFVVCSTVRLISVAVVGKPWRVINGVTLLLKRNWVKLKKVCNPFEFACWIDRSNGGLLKEKTDYVESLVNICFEDYVFKVLSSKLAAMVTYITMALKLLPALLKVTATIFIKMWFI